MNERVAPAPPRVEEQEKQLQERRDRFNIGALSLPDGANPETDHLIEANEAYQEFMIPKTGEVYRLSENPDQRPLGQKVREGTVAAGKAVAEYAKDPSLPSGEQVKGFVEGMDRDMERMLYTEDRTLGDAVYSAVAAGTAGQFGVKPPGALGAFTMRVKNALTRPQKSPSLRNDIGTTEFYSPIVNSIEQARFPEEGLQGENLLAWLEKRAQGVRKSELDAADLPIDPNKRYTKEEALQLARENTWNVTIEDSGQAWSHEQRIPTSDKQVEYNERTLKAKKEGTTFEPWDTHYDKPTLGHYRYSIKESPNQDQYLLIEEMQSDALQSGIKPKAKKRDFDEAYDEAIDRGPDDILDYIDNIDELDIYAYVRFDNLLRTGEIPEKGDVEYVERLAKEHGQEEILESLKNLQSYKKFSPADISYNLSELVRQKILEYFPSEELPGVRRALRNFSNAVGKNISSGTKDAPIKNVTEFVRPLLLDAIRVSQSRGITDIRIPSVEEIAKLRETATGDSPNPAFLRKIYKDGVEKAVRQINSEYEGQIKFAGTKNIDKIPDMEIEEDLLSEAQDVFEDRFELARLDEGLSEAQANRNNWYGKKLQEFLPDTSEDELDKLVEAAGDRLMLTEDEMDMLYTNMSDLRDDLIDYTQNNAISTTSLDISGFKDITKDELRFAEGGTVPDMDEQMSLFAYGGLEEESEMERDPVSNNEIPPGGTAEGVRDDVEVNLSEGEFVIPENITRFFGVKFFEDLIKQGNAQLAKMEEEGRFGNEPEDEELPFDVSELETEDEEMSFADGGFVPGEGPVEPGYTIPEGLPGSPYGSQPYGGTFEQKIFVNDAGQQRSIIFINGQPIQRIPKGFRLKGEAEEEAKEEGTAEEVKTGEEDVVPQGEDRWDRERNEAQNTANEIDVTSWGLEDFKNNLDFQGSKGEKGIQGMAAMMGPFVGPMKAGQGLTNRAAATQLQSLVDAGYGAEYQEMLDQYTEAGIEPIEKGSLLDRLLGVEWGVKGTEIQTTPRSDIRDTTPETNVYDALRDGIDRDETISGSTSTQGEFADVTESMTDLAREVAGNNEGDGRASPSEQLDAAERDAFDGVSTSDFMNKGGLVSKPEFKTRRKKSSGNKGLASRK